MSKMGGVLRNGLAKVASAQFGHLTHDQMAESGLSNRQIHQSASSGYLTRVLPCTYRMAGAPESWEGNLMAAVLWAGPSAIVSHRAAARLHNFPDARCSFYELSILGKKRAANPFLVLHQKDWDRKWITRVGNFPVSNAAATLIDLASVDPSVVQVSMDHALRKRMTTCKQLYEALEARPPNCAGRAMLKELIIDRAGNGLTESELETRVLALILSAGLPAPHRQFKVKRPGAEPFRIDLAYPEAGLGIECDGYETHSGFGAWRRDRQRTNYLISNGWRFLHVTWADLNQPHVWLEQLRAALGVEETSIRPFPPAR
ncbi:MAG TPA: hypothetical protein VND22_09545 [Actinomycetota bacterium]|nr:hypothetical protein [Actinomycetota bacterium]